MALVLFVLTVVATTVFISLCALGVWALRNIWNRPDVTTGLILTLSPSPLR